MEIEDDEKVPQIEPKPNFAPHVQSYSKDWLNARTLLGVISGQFIFISMFATAVEYYNPIRDFFLTNENGVGLYIGTVIMSIIVIILVHIFKTQQPTNLVLLVAYTLVLTFLVGAACAFTEERDQITNHLNVAFVVCISLLLRSLVQIFRLCALRGKERRCVFLFLLTILITISVIGMFIYASWAVKKPHEFKVVAPLMSSTLLVLTSSIIIQFVFHPGEVYTMIFAAVLAIGACAIIVNKIKTLTQEYEGNQYVAAVLSLFLDKTGHLLSCFVKDKPAEDKPAEDKPAEDKPAEDKPAEDKPAEDKPAEDKPTEAPPGAAGV